MPLFETPTRRNVRSRNDNRKDLLLYNSWKPRSFQREVLAFLLKWKLAVYLKKVVEKLVRLFA